MKTAVKIDTDFLAHMLNQSGMNSPEELVLTSFEALAEKIAAESGHPKVGIVPDIYDLNPQWAAKKRGI